MKYIMFMDCDLPPSSNGDDRRDVLPAPSTANILCWLWLEINVISILSSGLFKQPVTAALEEGVLRRWPR